MLCLIVRSRYGTVRNDVGVLQTVLTVLTRFLFATTLLAKRLELFG
jgi:hypothetical protein